MTFVGRYWWGIALCLVAFFSGASTGSSTPEADFPDCVIQGYEKLGNGYCDGNLNHAACGYDLGDCCECTCPKNQDYGCGASGYHCVDPAAGCFEDPTTVASRKRALQDDGDMMSFSPTSAPSGVPGLTASAAPTSFINAESLAAAASSLSSGEIAGIVVACLVIALIAGVVYFFYMKKKNAGDNMDYSSTESAALT